MLYWVTMRIAIDVSSAFGGPSGAGFYVSELTAALARAGGHELVLTSASWSADEQWAAARLPEGPGVSRVTLKVPQRLLLPAEHYAGLRWRERKYAALGVDVYFGPGNTLPPLGRMPGVVTVHHVGGELPGGAWPAFYFGSLTPSSARRADRVIAVSDHTRREILAAWDLDPAKVVRVHEGGPGPEFRPLRSGDAEAPVDAPFILHVGALFKRKNVPNLLKAYALLLGRNPRLPHALVLAGRDGDASAEIETALALPPLRDRVVRLGGVPREDLVALYRRASVLAYPSLLEGFGFPLLEAMACGTPVVAADAASLPEIGGDAALLCDAEKPEAIADALERALDPETAAALRARGPARAASFSWDKAARETIAVLASAREDARKS